MRNATAEPPFLEAILAELELSARLGVPWPRPVRSLDGTFRDRSGDPMNLPPLWVLALERICRFAGGEIEPREFAEWGRALLKSDEAIAGSGLSPEVLQSHRQASRADLALAVQNAESRDKAKSATGLPVEDLGELYPSPESVPAGWVLIAGLGSPTLPAPWGVAARAVGATIAATGFGLIAGGWEGVDQQTTLAFLHRLRMDRREPQGWLRVLMEPGRSPAVEHPDIEVADSVSDSIQRSVAAADAVVLVSGRGGTARIGRAALQQGVPVLSLKATGGDAESLYKDCRTGFSRWASSGIQSQLDRLAAPLPEALFALPSLLMEIGLDHRRRPDWRPSVSTAKSVPRRAPVRKNAGPVRRPK